jgi:hypothetical protein
LVGELEVKRPFGRLRYRKEDNIKVDLQEIECGAWGKGACSCECGNESSGSIKCDEFLEKLRNCWLLKNGSASWSCLLS